MLKNLLETALSLLLPKKEDVAYIENMSSENIHAMIPPANETSSEKFKALFQYKNPMMQKAIWEIKYRGNNAITKMFSHLLYEFIIETISDDMLFSNFDTPILVPIPASRKSMFERGHNQSVSIAKEIHELCKKGSFEISFTALKKIKETKHQSKIKNRTERLNNLIGSFSANPKEISGRNIILIDDVITTEGTMKEATKELHRAGAKKVIGFAIAH